jgi:predicted DCC family thiol-disulfide oxidoreductase YuxK
MNKFKVYFDGNCVVCSTEIGFYRTKPGAGALEWVDISSASFDAASEGLDPTEVVRVFHVRDENGHLVTGVDAFVEIWRRIPSLKMWVRLSSLPGAHWALQAGYAVFTRLRPYLPRSGPACSDGACAMKTARSTQ